MASTRFGIILFFAGVFALFVHTTLPFLWGLAGIRVPYPLIAAEGPLSYLPGFTPPLGALAMVIGGLIFGRQKGS
jgi:hypothetical protein